VVLEASHGKGNMVMGKFFFAPVLGISVAMGTYLCLGFVVQLMRGFLR
jgi:hypothetical protein